MPENYDLIIRGGLVYDGTGGSPFTADLAVAAGKIAAVGAVAGIAEEEIDATGKIVTPGFVDIHTHYDGQATWSEQLSPSSHHGVTTVVMGNCGVGFAPCRPADRERLITLMEAVEDIPEVVLAEGLSWEWETFPEYLDTLSQRRFDVDVAAQLPHSALRLYVMGDRAMEHGPASVEDNSRMAKIAAQAMRAGAIGFATSRTLQHRTGDGGTIPSYSASEAELRAIASAISEAGHGVIELAMDFDDVPREFGLLRLIADESGVPITYGLAQTPDHPNAWRELLLETDRAMADGMIIKPQVTPRGIGMLMGHELSCHPFSFCPSYRELLSLPFKQRIAALRRPEVKARILSEPLGEAPSPALERVRGRLRRFDSMFPLGDPPDYQPPRERSVARLAKAQGISAEELAYEVMLRNEGRGMLYLPSGNYVDFNFDAVHAMLSNPNSVLGLGDGGAHCGSICDASYPTFMLKYWASEAGSNAFALERVVRMLSAIPAEQVGLLDRGLLKPGFRADLNVIDHENLALCAPQVEHDMPANGRRLTQKARGYKATIVSGAVTYRAGRSTGAYPGRLVRGPQPRPPHAAYG